MIKRWLLISGWIALFCLLMSCAASRLETDLGTSLRLMKINQIWNPEAEKNIEPVSGFDGEAAQATVEKYRKDFEKPAPAAPYTLSIGVSGK